MSYTYTAFVAFHDANKRFVNLTEAPTLTAHNGLTGAALAGVNTITNIATGRYRVQVTDATLTDVIFGIVPAVADQTLHGDVPVMQEKVYHVADDILVDTAAMGATVWGYATRTLTQSATSIIAAVSGSSITDVRGNTWDIDVDDLTLDDNLIQFAIKRGNDNTDDQALLLIDSDTGLLVLNGVAATVAQNAMASLTYAGTTLTIAVDAEITAQLPLGSWQYGIQSITAADLVAESYGGRFVITADIVRATD